MKRALLLIPTLLGAEPSIHLQDEAAALQNLIATTERNLTAERQLQQLFDQYKELEDLLVLDDNPKLSGQRASQLMAIARQMVLIIHQNGLQDYFDKDFLDTINQLASVARRPKKMSGV